MKYLLLIVSIIFTIEAISCECFSNNVNSILEHSDYAFIGKAIKNITPSSTLSDSLDSTGYGTTIEFKIIKSIKGEFRDHVIILDQRGSGNCAHSFKLGSKYLVLGYNDRTLPSSPRERYQEYFTEDDFFNGVSDEKIDSFEIFFNNLRKKRPYVFSNDCNIFTSGSKQYLNVKQNNR